MAGPYPTPGQLLLEQGPQLLLCEGRVGSDDRIAKGEDRHLLHLPADHRSQVQVPEAGILVHRQGQERVVDPEIGQGLHHLGLVRELLLVRQELRGFLHRELHALGPGQHVPVGLDSLAEGVAGRQPGEENPEGQEEGPSNAV